MIAEAELYGPDLPAGMRRRVAVELVFRGGEEGAIEARFRLPPTWTNRKRRTVRVDGMRLLVRGHEHAVWRGPPSYVSGHTDVTYDSFPGPLLRVHGVATGRALVSSVVRWAL